MKDNFTIDDLIEIDNKLNNEKLSCIRRVFRQLGANYDDGDIILLNVKMFPDLRDSIYQNEKQIKITEYLPGGCPGLVFNKKNIERGLYENRDINVWKN